MGLPTKAKAKEIMKDGTVHGKPLTSKQRGLMAIIVMGKKPTKMKKAER